MDVQNIVIEGNDDLPSISFLFSEGILTMSGRSLPPNPYEFYKPIMEDLKQFLATWKNDVCFNIQMTYFNTASSKQILDLLNLFVPDENSDQGDVNEKKPKILAYKSLVINWHYNGDDEDMRDAGEDYADIIKVQNHPKISFNLVEKVKK